MASSLSSFIFMKVPIAKKTLPPTWRRRKRRSGRNDF